MNYIIKFFQKWRHAIIWTVLYGFAVWGILRGLFNFDIFSRAHWIHIAHARIHGFPGFAFGILILAALPLYVATMTVIMRNGAPLFEFKLAQGIFNKLKKIANLFTPVMIEVAPEQTPDTAPAPDTETPIDDTPAKTMPGELVGAFEHARNHINFIMDSDNKEQKIASNEIAMMPIPAAPDNPPPENMPDNGMPLPTDFDIPTPDDDDAAMPGLGGGFDGINMPTFTDINFDDTPQPTPTASDVADKLTKFLDGHKIEITGIENNIIITDKFAIALHDDNDFWVVDNESWFAAGKQKPSPIVSVQDIATARGLTPVLYLAYDNIMDIDTHRKTWTDDGILIITTPDELPI